MGRIRLTPAAAVIACVLGPGAAHAQQVPDLAAWNYDELRTGLSVERLTESAGVVDQDGERIGELEDLIVGPDGRIRKLVIEAGGLFDLGDTHFAYPFDQAAFAGPDRIVVELDEDNIEDYSLFADVDDDPAQGRNWRISELIHDYVYLEDGYRFGWINDAVIGADGTIKAIVVLADVRVAAAPRPIALPFLPQEGQFDPSMYYYQVPYSADEVAELDVFFADQMETHTSWDEE